VIFTSAVADAIADGTVNVAFRRWSKARVRAGTSITTSAGVVLIERIDEIDPDSISDDDARAAGAASRDELFATFRGPEHLPVFRIEVRFHGADPRVSLRADTDLDGDALRELEDALRRMDLRADTPWTTSYLKLVANRPGVRAADLAASVGSDTAPFKLRIRKLKNLGLTHSLDVGYRLSPRGRHYLEISAKRLR
jgi:hypothetical protein